MKKYTTLQLVKPAGVKLGIESNLMQKISYYHAMKVASAINEMMYKYLPAWYLRMCASKYLKPVAMRMLRVETIDETIYIKGVRKTKKVLYLNKIQKDFIIY